MPATLLVLGLCALAPAAAEARPPRITERPVVAGTPQVGATLEAQGAAWEGDPEPTVSWQWVRCDGPGADQRSCPEIDGATRTTYTVQEADLGKRVRAILPAGSRLVISVTKPGRIGKHTTIAIRRGKAPRRVDRCLVPGPRKPVRCPGA